MGDYAGVIPDNSMSKKNNRTMKYPGLKEDVYIPRLKPDPAILDNWEFRRRISW